MLPFCIAAVSKAVRTLRLWATREAAVMRWMAYRRLVSCPMRVSSAAASSARSVSSSSACVWTKGHSIVSPHKS